MWKSLMSSRFASWVVGMVSLPKPRQLQQELDLQRLYVVTQIRAAALKGRVPSMQLLLQKAQSLEAPAVRRDVEAALQQQVVEVAEALHETLIKAGDPVPAAASMVAAAQQLQRRKARQASGLSKLLRSVSEPAAGQAPAASFGGGLQQTVAASGLAAAGRGAGAGAEAVSAASGSGSGSSDAPPGAAWEPEADQGGVAMGREELAAALRQRLGFSLTLRPSSVAHPEAGTGLFVEGEVRPGTVVALFPGVLYGRTQLAHMPNFPKVDTDNPYLSCRYDQSIVDCKPWGRGDPGGEREAGAGAGAEGSTSGQAGSGGWWSWAGPLSASLRQLEGRHPLALGHFVNHPGAGQVANVLEASLDLPLDHPLLDTAARPWLRAYLPVVQPPLHYDPYGRRAGDAAGGEDDEDDSDDDEDEEEDGQKGDGKGGAEKAERRRRGAGGAGAGGVSLAVHEGPSPAAGRRRGPGELPASALLLPPGGIVRLLLLVAVRPLRDGEEVLQNYRMNPHVQRPDWYVVHDAEAEQRRWAKSHSLNLGFKGASSSAAAAAAAARGGSGGG